MRRPAHRCADRRWNRILNSICRLLDDWLCCVRCCRGIPRAVPLAALEAPLLFRCSAVCVALLLLACMLACCCCCVLLPLHCKVTINSPPCPRATRVMPRRRAPSTMTSTRWRPPARTQLPSSRARNASSSCGGEAPADSIFPRTSCCHQLCVSNSDNLAHINKLAARAQQTARCSERTISSHD